MVSAPLFIQERAFENSRLDQGFEFVGCTSFQVNPLKLKAPMNANNGKGGGSTYRRTHFWRLQAAASPMALPAGDSPWGRLSRPRRPGGTWSDACVTPDGAWAGGPATGARPSVGAPPAGPAGPPQALLPPPRPARSSGPGREADASCPHPGARPTPSAGAGGLRVPAAGPWTHILRGKSYKYFYLL